MAAIGLVAAVAVALALLYALPALAQEPGAGPLAGFTLVDASDQTELATLTDGASVELADPNGGSYGIRADLADGESVGSVSLELSGAKSVGPRTENLAPYSLYGDGGADALDGEPLPAGSYTLTATAYAESRLGGDELGTLEVSFTIAQTNRAPVFGSATYSFSVAEDAATGTAVGSVSATDADDDGLTYSIETGNGDGKFAMDGSSGAITTTGALDHATTPSYALTVQADDGNGGTATATVNVTVTDVEETSPGPLTGFTLVDASDQTMLAALTDGASVELADPDGGSYGIRADVDANANIGSVRLALSGAKTVSRTENLAPYSLYGDGGADDLNGDTLPAGSYTLTATAYANSNLGGDELGTLEMSFTVTQANRSPQFGSATYNFSVAEDAANGTAVGTVSASDADSDGLTYSIESGNGDGKFAIDGSSGAVTTAGALDHATTPSYALTVQADDGNGGTDTATVNVTVTEVVENTAPEFGGAAYNFSIADDAATGTAVGTVSATDADSDGLTYSIESGNGDGKFAIDGSSGAITTAGALDHATTPSYTLTMQADDGNGGTATATVTISVTEASANTPSSPPQENTHPLTSVAPPINLSVESLTHQSATLTWRVPAQPAAVSVSEMYLERAEGSGSFDHVQSVATDLDTFGSTGWNVTSSGLTENTRYRFRVKLETADEAVYSDQLNVLTNVRLAPAGTPDTPEITPLHSGIFEVDWEDIDRAQYYEVRLWDNGRARYVVLPGQGIEIEFDGSRAIVRNLSPNLRYYAFEVQAVNNVDASGWSDYGILWNQNWDFSDVPVPDRLTEPAPTPPPAAPAPNPPVNLAGNVTHESVILSWEAPAQPEGVSVTGMLLEVAGTDGAIIYPGLVASALDESQSSNWERVVAGLSPGVEYRSRVSLYTDASIAFSDVLRLTTHSDPPALPTDLQGFVTSESVLLLWTMPDQPDWVQVDRLEVGRAPAMAEGAERLEWQEGGGKYQYTDGDVEAGADYVYDVRLVTGTGTYRSQGISLTTDAAFDFSKSDGSDVTGQPGPTGLEADLLDPETVSLDWTAPVEITPTGYQILRREEGVDQAGAFRILVANTSSTSTYYEDNSVEAETTYEYQVKGIAGKSLTAPSNSVSVTTPVEPVFDDATELDVAEAPQRKWHTYWDAMEVSTVKEVSPVVPVYIFTLDSASQVSFEVKTGGWPNEYFPRDTDSEWYRLIFDVRDERGNVLVRSRPKHPNSSVIPHYLGATLDAGTYYLVSWAPPGQLYCPGSCPPTKEWKIAVEYWLEEETNANDESSGAEGLDVSEVENISKYFFGMLDRGEGDGSDYFKFTIDGRKLVKLSLEVGQEGLHYEIDYQPNREVNASLSLKDSEGKELAASTGLANGTPIKLLLEDAGTYYIHVSSLDDDNNLYKFKFGLFNPDYAPTVSGTLDVTKAAKSEQRREVTMAEDVHEHFFEFTIDEEKDVGVGLTGLDSNFDVDLISEYGRTLHTSASSGTGGEWMRHVLEPGKYYVRVHRDSSNASAEADYTLRFHLDPATWYTRWTEFLFRRWGERHWQAPDLPVFPDPLDSVVYENDDTFSSSRDLDRIALEWDLPDAGSSTVTRYVLQRSEDRGTTWTDIHASTTSFTSFNDPHVQPYEDYRYRMKLETGDGDVYSSVHIVTVGSRIFTTNLRATEITHDSLKLEWDMPFEDEDVEGYLILDSKLRAGSFRILVLSTRTKDTSYVLENLSPERTYDLMVIPIIHGDWASEVGYSEIRFTVSENSANRTTRKFGATTHKTAGNFHFRRTDDRDFWLSWFFGGTGSASGYEVERTTRGAGGTEIRVYEIDGKFNTIFVDRYFRAGVTSYRVRHVYTDGTYGSWMTGVLDPCHSNQCHISYSPQSGSLRE